MSLLKRKKKKQEIEQTGGLEEIPIAAVPVDPAPLNGEQPRYLVNMTEPEMKDDMHYFFSRGAPRVADDVSWMLAFQYAYLETDPEGKEVKDHLMSKSREIVREFLPLVDKYAIGQDMNALLYALMYLQGTVFGVNYSSEDVQRYVECGQLMKKAQYEQPVKPFGRDKLGYG